MKFAQRVINAVWSLRGVNLGSNHPRDPILAQWFGGGSTTKSGQVVTPETALTVVSVFAAIRLLSETIATLPLILYRREGQGKVRAETTPLFNVLRNQPNKWQTPAEYIEMSQAHLLLRGNAYSEILSTGGRAVDQLIPLHPDRVQPFRAPDQSIAYRYQPLDGPQRIILQDEMFHLRDLTLDGIVGISRIRQSREAIGLSMAESEHAARLFSNGARPSGVLKHPNLVDPEALDRLKKQWRETYEGSTNASKTIILEEGMDYQTLGMTSDDAQFLESRKFSVNEVARLFRVPPHMIGDLEKATFSNIEAQSLEFVIYSLRSWLTKWEQAIRRDLITDPNLFVEFLLEGLLRGDFKSRTAGYASAKQWGWLNTNEIRRRENLNGIGPQGDVYLAPVNMVPSDQLGEQVDEIDERLRLLEERHGN